MRNLLSKYVSLSLAVSVLSGCNVMDLVNWDAGPASPYIAWGKYGVSEEVKSKDWDVCSAHITLTSTARDEWDIFDICMLNKGYRFDPQPSGYQSSCYGRNDPSVRCRSARGERIKGVNY